MRLLLSTLILFLIFGFSTPAKIVAVDPADAILGDWMSTDSLLKVRVFKQNGEFKATILWFEDEHYKCKMGDCRDVNNPNPALRTRNVLGLQVLSGLTYVPEDNEWENGEIYDSNSGDSYDSVVWMDGKNKLSVRGYYLFEWLGRTLEFYRV